MCFFLSIHFAEQTLLTSGALNTFAGECINTAFYKNDMERLDQGSKEKSVEIQLYQCPGSNSTGTNGTAERENRDR